MAADIFSPSRQHVFCFFSYSHNVSPTCASKGTCASHVCNICLQFAKHLCSMVWWFHVCQGSQRVSAIYPQSCILECWNADLQTPPVNPSPRTAKIKVVWGETWRAQLVRSERGCTSEPAQAGSSLCSLKIYSRRNTNRKTVSHSWPVFVVMITLICAHDCRRHLIYKPH